MQIVAIVSLIKGLKFAYYRPINLLLCSKNKISMLFSLQPKMEWNPFWVSNIFITNYVFTRFFIKHSLTKRRQSNLGNLWKKGCSFKYCFKPLCDHQIAYGAIRFSGLGVFEPEICMSEFIIYSLRSYQTRFWIQIKILF